MQAVVYSERTQGRLLDQLGQNYHHHLPGRSVEGARATVDSPKGYSAPLPFSASPRPVDGLVDGRHSQQQLGVTLKCLPFVGVAELRLSITNT